MNNTSYAVMLISDYNNSAHMERVEADDGYWGMTESEATATRDQQRSDGGTGVVAVRRTKLGDQYRFSVI